MAIKKISAEVVNANRSKWFIFRSIDVAKKFSKETAKGKPKQIYEIPNGAYVVRKGSYKGKQPFWW